MPISQETRSQLVSDLDDALRTGEPIDPLTDEHDLTIDEAYEIQGELIEKRKSRGQRRIGHKIGLTSEGIQNQLGVDEPDFGKILDDMFVSSGEIPMDDLIEPRVEPEIGFVLDEDLSAPVTYLDVLSATRGVLPVVEVIDSRVADWDIQIQDTIADNASSACIVAAESIHDVANVDLSMEAVKLYRNGRLESSGIGANVLGHPARAVAWLVNRIGESGERIEAGELVLSGSFVPATDLAEGDVFEVRFSTIGSVTATTS